jgi:hypothetical protein
MPWIFADIAREVYEAEIPRVEISLPELYALFVEALCRFQPERRLGRLKEFTHYFSKNYFFGHHLASRVQSSQTVEEALNRAETFFAVNETNRKLPCPVAKIRAVMVGCNSQNPRRGTGP